MRLSSLMSILKSHSFSSFFWNDNLRKDVCWHYPMLQLLNYLDISYVFIELSWKVGQSWFYWNFLFLLRWFHNNILYSTVMDMRKIGDNFYSIKFYLIFDQNEKKGMTHVESLKTNCIYQQLFDWNLNIDDITWAPNKNWYE